MTASEASELTLPTQRSPWRFSQRATGLPWNLTFADAAEQVGDSESGHSQVAIIDLGKVPTARRHPKAAYSRCRPFSDARIADLTSGSGRYTRKLTWSDGPPLVLRLRGVRQRLH